MCVLYIHMLTCMVYVVGGREMQGRRRRRRNTWNLLSPDRMDMERRASGHQRTHATSWCPCRRRIWWIVHRRSRCCVCTAWIRLLRPGNNESRLTCRVSGCWRASCKTASSQTRACAIPVVHLHLGSRRRRRPWTQLVCSHIFLLVATSVC